MNSLAVMLVGCLLGGNLVQASPYMSVRRDVSGRHDERIFHQRMGENQWAERLRNPCHHNGGIDSIDDNSIDRENVLNVDGREGEIWAMAGNTLARMRHIERHLSVVECQAETLGSLPSMPSNSTDPLSPQALEDIYRAFLFLSAHFRYMSDDWRDGRACAAVGKTAGMANTFQRKGEHFEQIMCVLMAPANPPAAPYPSPRMQREIYVHAFNTPIYHYHDCNGRMLRDCIVYRYAQELLHHVQLAAAARRNQQPHI